MSKKAIGIFTSNGLPLNLLNNILKKFPQHYLYIINPSFSNL